MTDQTAESAALDSIVLTRPALWALVLVSTLGWLSTNQLPYEIAVLTNAYGFGSRTAGIVASLEIAALAISVTWMSRAIGRRNKRWLCIYGVALALLASVTSMDAHSLLVLAFARAGFGVGLGFIAASCNALPSLAAKPERIFAYMQFAVGIIFILLMYVQPLVDRLAGRAGLFVIQLVLLAVIGPLAILLPAGLVGDQRENDRRQSTMGAATLVLLAALILMTTGAGAIWAFAEQPGEKLGLSQSSIALLFSGSAFLNLLGSTGAAVLGVRFGSARPIAFGLVALGTTALLMYGTATLIPYAIGVLILNALGSFVLPYFLGALAKSDATGRSAALGGAGVNFGFAAGPFTAGTLAMLDHAALGVGIALMFVASLCASLYALRGLVRAGNEQHIPG